MIENDRFYGARGRYQFQSQLLLNGLEKTGLGRIIGERRTRPHHSIEVTFVWRRAEFTRPAVLYAPGQVIPATCPAILVKDARTRRRSAGANDRHDPCTTAIGVHDDARNPQW